MKLEEELLYHNRRKKIYKIILENPGIHQRALEKKTKIPSGCLRYHILRLTKYGLIIKKCEKGYTRYFVANNIDNSDKLIIGLLRQEMPRKILILLLVQKGYYSLTKEQIKSIANTSNWDKDTVDRYKIRLDLRTVNYHLQKLLHAGIIERLRDGRKISYRIVDECKILYLLNRYRNTFDDFLVDDTLSNFNLKRFNIMFIKSVDKIIDSIKEVFPPPFFV